MNVTGPVQSLGVTYFARDPLRSYFFEPQKNEFYFLNGYKQFGKHMGMCKHAKSCQYPMKHFRLCLRTLGAFLVFLAVSLLRLSELFSNSFIEKIFLKFMGENQLISKSRNYDVFDLVCVCILFCPRYCPINFV